jgi:hypothetical protein
MIAIKILVSVFDGASVREGVTVSFIYTQRISGYILRVKKNGEDVSGKDIIGPLR